MDILTSNCMVHLILAASSVTHNEYMRILGHTSGDCIGSIPVDWLVSVLMLCTSKWRIGWSACRLARWGGCVAMIRFSGIAEEDDTEKKWEALSIINLASSQNGISNSQLAHCTEHASYCIWRQATGISHSPAICSKSVRCCLCVSRDKYRFTTADMSGLPEMISKFFDGKDVCWCVSQEIAAMLRDTDSEYQVMLYG